MTSSISVLHDFADVDRVNWEARPVLVLDVDRTIINGTSWYRACVTSDLLIAENRIADFERLNAAAYGESASLPLHQFRAQTLSLVDTQTSASACNRFREMGVPSKMLPRVGTQTGATRFRAAGFATGSTFRLYPEIVELFAAMDRLYEGAWSPIFLTAGYSSFMEGLVARLLFDSGCSRQKSSTFLLGSELDFTVPGFSESRHVNQEEKERVVSRIIDAGADVVLVADDTPFSDEFVRRLAHTGVSLHCVAHKPGTLHSQSWRNFIDTNFNDHIERELRTGAHTSALCKRTTVGGAFLEYWTKNSDSIGVCSLASSEYAAALEVLRAQLPPGIADRFSLLLSSLFLHKADRVFLRGPLYYYWIPESVSGRHDCTAERWKTLWDIAIELASLLFNGNHVRLVHCGLSVQAVAFSVLDHLANAALALLNGIECAELETNSDATDPLADQLDGLLIRCFRQMDAWLSGVDVANVPPVGSFEIDLARCGELIGRFAGCHKGLRELDDKAVIFSSAESVASTAMKRGDSVSTIVSFPYGGIELGYAFRAAWSRHSGGSDPSLLHCHFSSQRLRRSGASLIRLTSDDLESYVPLRHRHLWRALNSGTVALIYDNNATTYGTLQIARDALAARGVQVRTAVAAINYANLTCFVKGLESETPVTGWRRLLDYAPVTEYVTAFGTWGTGQKSHILQRQFGQELLRVDFRPDDAASAEAQLDYKACRVHNIPDLMVALSCGATMIGIHAVSHSTSAARLDSGFDPTPALPVASQEVASIRAMQSRIPRRIKQVLVVERCLPIPALRGVLAEYGMTEHEAFLQIQHHVTPRYLAELKTLLLRGLIVATGVDDPTLHEYVPMLSEHLRPERDIILVDFSKHQPHLLVSGSPVWTPTSDARADHAAGVLANSHLRVLIADDTSPQKLMKTARAFKRAGVRVCGIDMQNALERTPSEQIFVELEDGTQRYFAKLRKQPAVAGIWRGAFRDICRSLNL